MPILINPLEDNIETRIVKSSATLFGLLFQAAPASAKSVKVLKTYSTQSQSYYANLDQFYVNKSLSKKNDFYSHNYNGNLGWPFRKFSTNKSEQVLKPNGKTSIYRFVKFSSTKPGVWIWRGHLTKEPQQLFKKSISNHNHFGLKHVNTIRKELFKLRVALIQTKVNDHEKDPGATIDWFKASGSAYEIDFETLTDSITKKKTYYWENNTPHLFKTKERQKDVNKVLSDINFGFKTIKQVNKIHETKPNKATNDDTDDNENIPTDPETQVSYNDDYHDKGVHTITE